MEASENLIQQVVANSIIELLRTRDKDRSAKNVQQETGETAEVRGLSTLKFLFNILWMSKLRLLVN